MSFRWSETTAIYGGTFDPPHLQHREALLGILRVPGVKRVIVVPAADPPHKTGTTPATHRLEMARLAFGGIPGVEVSDTEIKRSQETGNPSYSFDTLAQMRHQIPSLAFVIGTDQLAELPRWHRFPEVLTLSHWLVLERKPDGKERAAEPLKHLEASGIMKKHSGPHEHPTWSLNGASPARYLSLVPTQAQALASREIREEIGRSGKPPANSLSPEIASYLMQHRLYGTDRGSK